MSATHNIKTKLLATAVGVAAAAVAPALLFAGAGTAQANGSSPFATDASDCSTLGPRDDRLMSNFGGMWGPLLPCALSDPANSVPNNGSTPVWTPTPPLPPTAYDIPYNPYDGLNNPNAPAPATMGTRDPNDDGTYRPPWYGYPEPWEAPDSPVNPSGPGTYIPGPITGWDTFIAD